MVTLWPSFRRNSTVVGLIFSTATTPAACSPSFDAKACVGMPAASIAADNKIALMLFGVNLIVVVL